jgi:hypothetical protein
MDKETDWGSERIIISGIILLPYFLAWDSLQPLILFILTLKQ